MTTYLGLACFKTEFTPEIAWAHHSVEPKIVNGRFLTLSTFTYDGKDQDLNMESLGSISLCEHLESHGIHLLVQPEFPDTLAMSLAMSLQMVLKHRHFPVTNHCTVCLVDYEVAWEGESLVLRAWHDFGGEGPVQLHNWRAVAQDRRISARPEDRPLIPPQHCIVKHVGGSVRAEYESG